MNSTDNNLYAVNASTGKQIWQFSGTQQLGGDGLLNQPGMAISGSTVYVNCKIDNIHAGVCALKLSTGALLWTWAIYDDPSGNPVGSSPYTGPVVSNGVVVVGEADTASYGHVGYFVGLNAKTGAPIWQIGNCGGPNGPNYCNEIGPATPAVSGGLVYYATFGVNDFDGVCAVQITTGAYQWCYATNDINSSIAVQGNTACVNTFDGTLYALNAKTGVPLWTSTVCGGRCGHPLDPPAIAKGVVYYGGTYYGYVSALSAKTGKVLWTNTAGNFASAPSVANGVVYAECYGTCALDASSGATLWNSNYGGGTGSQPVVVNGTLYGVCGYNNLCAYNVP